MAPESERSATVKSVERAWLVLEHLAGCRTPRSALEISREVGLHRTVVHRLLRTLEASSMVREVSRGKYSLGARALTLASAYLDNLPIRKVAAPYLVDLSTTLIADRPWAVTLGLPVEEWIVLVERIWARQAPVGSLLGMGAKLPIDHSAGGLAVLATRDPKEVKALLGASRATKLAPRLDAVRKAGIAYTSGELQPGIDAGAVAVLDGTGAPVAAVMVAGPDLPESEVLGGELGRGLRQAAAAISDTLGSL